MPLPEPVPELTSLDLLVSVSELGSISAAAGAHGITQPAASMRLRKLEQVLGIHLLERATTGSRLTPAGEATVEWATPVLHALESLLVGTSALHRSARSSLRLAASMTVAEYLVPSWLGKLAGERGGTSVSLEMGNTATVAGLVADGRADLGFIEGARPPGRLSFREVLEDELVVVVGASHPWARRRRVLSPDELARTALLLREEGSGTRQVLAEALAEYGLEVVSAMELGSTTAIKAAAGAGAGPAVLSALAVADERESGALVAVPCEGLRLHRVIRAVWSGRLGPVAARLLAISAGRHPVAGQG